MNKCFQGAFLGSLVADALSMPVHWYYDRDALKRDYGQVDHFLEPRNPHPDSILWRSTYKSPGPKGDILHDQAKYWGKRGVHYHQFLEAGQNTVNLQLAVELWHQVSRAGEYRSEDWLERYISLMLTAGWHGDTYVEEYHRAFFERYATGRDPGKCGIDDNHIGGLARVPALLAALPEDSPVAERRRTVQEDVSLTHLNKGVLQSADCLVQLLCDLSGGATLEEALQMRASNWFSLQKARKYADLPDTVVIGDKWSPACYIDESFPASLYLAWKYRGNFRSGVVANAMVGGDNCHRGVVVGALLGALHPIPEDLLSGLKADLGSVSV